MSEPMRMQPPEIRSGANKIGHAGDDLAGVLRTLNSALQAEGPCWGADEAGRTFAETYVPACEDVTGALDELAAGLGDIKTNLNRTADDVESRDQVAAENIGKLRPPSA